jgi:DNA-binding GntR family transcriptional regulator
MCVEENLRNILEAVNPRLQSVVESIYTQVREQVISGVIVPGTPMRQEDVASRFGVSKIPVREAFSRLEREGLLELRPRRGYTVASFNIREIVEIFDLRAVLEEHAGRLAAKNRTPADLARVKAILLAMELLDPGGPSYFDSWCLLNRQFHDAIIESTQAKNVTKTTVQLRNVVEPYIRLESVMTKVEAIAEQEHRQIVAALEAGDEKLLGALSAMHCYHTRDRLVEALRASKHDENRQEVAAGATAGP